MPWPSRRRKCPHCAGFGSRQVSCDYQAADGEGCTNGKFGTRCLSCEEKWKPEDKRKFGNPYICRSCNGSSFYRPICPSCKGSALKGVPCHACGETGELIYSSRWADDLFEFLPFGKKKKKVCHHCLGSGKRPVACEHVTANGESCDEGHYFSKCLSCKGTGKSSDKDTICELCPGSGYQKFTCPSCHGIGSTEQPCPMCCGSGYIDD